MMAAATMNNIAEVRCLKAFWVDKHYFICPIIIIFVAKKLQNSKMEDCEMNAMRSPLSRGLGVGGQTSHMIAIINVYQY